MSFNDVIECVLPTCVAKKVIHCKSTYRLPVFLPIDVSHIYYKHTQLFTHIALMYVNITYYIHITQQLKGSSCWCKVSKYESTHITSTLFFQPRSPVIGTSVEPDPSRTGTSGTLKHIQQHGKSVRRSTGKLLCRGEGQTRILGIWHIHWSKYRLLLADGS